MSEVLVSQPSEIIQKESDKFTASYISKGKDKLNPNKNEDSVVVTDSLLAVIDGATPKGNLTFGDQSGGEYASSLVSEALKQSLNLTGQELVDFVSGFMQDRFKKDGYEDAISNSPEARPFAFFSAAKIIGNKLVITQIGDVGFRVNGFALHENPKEIDSINAQKRKEAILRIRAETPDLPKDDLLKRGREAIVESLNNQVINYQNRPENPLGYGAMDGQKVDPKFVKTFTYDLKSIRSLEIFSDGYFRPADKPTIESWEDSFKLVEELDPDKLGDFPSTKGSSQASYTDDRSILIARFEDKEKELGEVNNPYFDILAAGSFGEGQIQITQNLQEQYPQELDDAVEAVWESRNKARLEKGQKPMTATPQLKLKSVDTKDGNLVIELTEGTYKDHIARQDKAFREKFKDFDPKIIGTNIVVRTADGQLMIVQRGLDAATKPGAMSVVGGQWDITKDCDENGVWDPFKTISRELEEETGVKRDEIDGLRATGIIYNKAANNPSMIFYADSSLSASQIKERIGDGEVLVKFIPDEKQEVEHSILWWTSSPSPSGASALALYGKEKFGEEWFNRINQRIQERHERFYSNLTSDQLKRVDNKAARRMSRL